MFFKVSCLFSKVDWLLFNYDCEIFLRIDFLLACPKELYDLYKDGFFSYLFSLFLGEVSFEGSQFYASLMFWILKEILFKFFIIGLSF